MRKGVQIPSRENPIMPRTGSEKIEDRIGREKTPPAILGRTLDVELHTIAVTDLARGSRAAGSNLGQFIHQSAAADAPGLVDAGGASLGAWRRASGFRRRA